MSYILLLCFSVGLPIDYGGKCYEYYDGSFDNATCYIETSNMFLHLGLDDNIGGDNISFILDYHTNSHGIHIDYILRYGLNPWGILSNTYVY